MLDSENKLFPFDIQNNCDEGIALGMKSLQAELFINYPRISHTFRSRRYSLNSLLKKHLDEPLENFLSSYYGDRHREFFQDFKLSEISKHFNHRLDLTRNQIVSNSLRYWHNEIFNFSAKFDFNDDEQQIDYFSKDQSYLLAPTHDYSEPTTSSELKDRPSLQDRFYGTIDTLMLFIEELQEIKSRTDKIPDTSIYFKEQHLTKHRLPEDAHKTCLLCWRKTERHNIKNNIKNNIKKRNIAESSAKFCTEHAIKGGGKNSKNWSNYIKGRRYKDRYLKEFDKLFCKDSAKDAPPYLIRISRLKEIFEKVQGYPFNLNGKRALAYYLVRSGLDNDGYRRIYKAKNEEELSNAQIAREFKISRQAVGQMLRKIELKLHAVRMKTKAAEGSLLYRNH